MQNQDIIAKIICVICKMSGVPPEFRPVSEVYSKIKSQIKSIPEDLAQKVSNLTSDQQVLLNTFFESSDHICTAFKKMDFDTVHANTTPEAYTANFNYVKKLLSMYHLLMRGKRSLDADMDAKISTQCYETSLSSFYLTLSDQEKTAIDQCYAAYPDYYDAIVSKFSLDDFDRCLH